ncbi:response regulator [Arcobacter aquimarinus]|uniref:Multi-sensor domain-containing response regulator c-di-GMP phosphodiesterase, RpfG family n=1 Tax=Arcobacter aquimarinus TaxID=1315211 RepID=A0AAE7E1H0_9BACT|nr:response regulator [Arcobacter aquimarinus]QKE25912.1 multi-sensor domain-containing response regulator c-di-GMP phosphodiesterase, RpfG family [Arcobacter aquimarinus]RXI35588.1 response regulator receiver protein [Arcobacter aquimarinus]
MNSKKNSFVFDESKCKILIVDDSKTINNLLTREFNNFNYKTYNAYNLKEARKIIETNHIDYLILDINLPDGKGYDLFENLENTSIKTFILTSQKDEEKREFSFKKGIIDFIIKDNFLFQKIEQIIEMINKIEQNKNETILVIDDSFVIQQQLKDLFENRNYNVLLASNEKDALKMIQEEQPDLMILDVELKKANGIDFLQKNNELIISELKIPVIIISGTINITITRDSYKAGAVDVIKKPFVIEEMNLKIDLWIDYKRKQKELNRSSQLLKQYKNAVDERSIVSKTDEKGIITYVNEQFCLLSGYSKKELIGKNHNIVSHPDNKKELYKKIWNTIKNEKKSWTGKIKNKKKDGTYYWIDALIKPILDKNGNIEEFIALKNDITEQEDVKEYFQLKLKGSQKDLNHSIKLAREYEKAIDISSILLRTDADGKINYVNNKFVELTEFTKKELIGSDYRIFKNIETENEIFKNIESLLEDKIIFNGILKNRSKFGKTYWINITIVPIKDDNHKTIEYMWIINDLTELFNLNEEIQSTQKEIIYKMGEIGETRSKETGNHVKRVAEYSKLLATLYGLDEQQANILLVASPMHDIGKVGIPDSILKKPGKLTTEEFEIMKEHAMIGYNILKDSNREILKAAAIVAKEHHEKWNGSGYPFGLKGEEIHIYGRITAIADVFDALGSERCYKKAWEDEKIFELFRNQRAKHFDPKLIDLFFDNIQQFNDIRDKYKD